MSRLGAVVLAGGAALRMGGAPKPVLPVGGVSLLARVLGAVAQATPRVVVGPAELAPHLPARTRLTREQPPGGGPVAATAAGLALLPTGTRSVALLAADLPFLTPAMIEILWQASTGPDHDAAVLVDDTGRPQWLCGVWNTASLRGRLAALGPPAGLGMRQLAAGLRVALVSEQSAATGAPPSWFDCDTDQDLRRAEEWSHGSPPVRTATDHDAVAPACRLVHRRSRGGRARR